MPAILSYAQSDEPSAILEYYDNELEIEITAKDGYPVDEIFFGMELQLGDIVKTKKGFAEIRLNPNGTIMKLAPDTIFQIETLQGELADANEFALFAGKLRAIVARLGIGENYSIKTPSAVCGVRGTDFGLHAIEGVKDAAFVQAGSVEFTSLKTGETIIVDAGSFADALSSVFEPIQLAAEEIAQLFEGLEFAYLDESVVPGHEPTERIAQADDLEGSPSTSPSTGTANEAETDAVSPVEAGPSATETGEGESTQSSAEESTADESPSSAQPATDPAQQPDDEADAGQVSDAPTETERGSKVLDFLGKFFGMEVGTLNIGGTTYSKFVLQPTIDAGKFKMALYLPVIFSTNLFDLDDWYNPPGNNNEWSFGTDQTDVRAIVGDVFEDLFLKIKYIKFGELRDPFYFKIGNVDDMTVGHGMIMRDYANDAEFPSVRQIGVNLGLDLTYFGIEAVLDNAARPEIFGGRIFFRPAAKKFPFAIGLTGITDISPDAGMTLSESLNPAFLNAGFDLDFPFIENDIVSLVMFADIAAMFPYVDDEVRWDAFYSGESFSFRNFKNYGFAAGFFGNILVVDWWLEYRYSKGTFQPAFYSTTYDRLRGEYLLDLLAYLDDPSDDSYSGYEMGIYGEAGVDIAGIFRIELGYLWPWNAHGYSDSDFLHIEFRIMPDVIPVVGIYGSVSYDRTGLVPTLIDKPGFENATLIDERTVIQGELGIPIGGIVDIVGLVTTTVAMDDNGSIRYDSNGDPLMALSIGLETRIHF